MRKKRSSSNLNFVLGACAGAGLMFLLDPQSRGRRTALRDKIRRSFNLLGRQTSKQARNVVNHVEGAVAERRARRTEGSIPDDILVERVRAQVGHVVSHPGALEIQALDGIVTIRGPLLSGEREKILDRLDVTRGVLDCRLEVIEPDSTEVTPALQDESRTQSREPEERIA